MQIIYFASVRETVGRDGDEYDLPDGIQSIDDCLTWLSAQSSAHAAAFANPEKLRFALDQQMAKSNASLKDARELAIFPPVTGG
ncbi:MAG: molybdopterin synthase sulfur carrier subunit [Sphingomonadales bacterium]|nr:molybdopterin synthase sulfur carrier subunit [Sphingomonadales bacterium]